MQTTEGLLIQDLTAEVFEQDRLIVKMQAILHETAVALKGEDTSKMPYQWEDLPKLAHALRAEFDTQPDIIEFETTPVVIDWKHPTAELKVAINLLLNKLNIPFCNTEGEIIDLVDRIRLACDNCS
jgi:hypothetical protein